MKYKINGLNQINNKQIDPKIFEQQLTEYEITETEQETNSLINWISETKNESNKFLMKEDLKYLLSLSDKYILSSISTNEYITENDEYGQQILKEIYNLNKKLLCKKQK